MPAQKFKGKDLHVEINGIAIGCSKSCDLTLTTKLSDTTSKCDTDANGNIWNSGLPTSMGWKITDSGFTIYDNTSGGGTNEYSTGAMMKAQMNQQYVYVTCLSADRKVFYGGNAWLTSNKTTAQVEDVTTYDVEITGDGPLSIIPVS